MAALALPDADSAVPPPSLRFQDGGAVRFEIPSVDGPRVLESVLEQAAARALPVHRVSQGSGAAMLTDAEISAMAALGAQAGIEVALVLSPRPGHDRGGRHRAAGAVAPSRAWGVRRLAAALDDLGRAYALGIRSFLAADEGLLPVVGELRTRGLVPADARIQVSVIAAGANPASVRLAERQGATTLSVATDLTLGQLGAIRRACAIPLAIYLESPDDSGGLVRDAEWHEMAMAAAPVYLKFGLGHAPGLYPWSAHLEATALRMAAERVQRFEVLWEEIRRRGLEHLVSPLPVRTGDLAVPDPARSPPVERSSRLDPGGAQSSRMQ